MVFSLKRKRIFFVCVCSRYSGTSASETTNHQLSWEVFPISLNSIGKLSWLRINEASTLDYKFRHLSTKAIEVWEVWECSDHLFRLHCTRIFQKYSIKYTNHSKLIFNINSSSDVQYFQRLKNSAPHLDIFQWLPMGRGRSWMFAVNGPKTFIVFLFFLIFNLSFFHTRQNHSNLADAENEIIRV